MELKIGKNFSIDADKLVTSRTCIIGQSGSGKSYAIAVICEELAENNIGFCIIDTEGEYFSLKEKYPILWVGPEEADIDISKINLKSLAKHVIKKGFPLIFDISEISDQKEIVSNFVSELYNVESKEKKPYLLIVEEVDKFAPQKGKVLKEINEVSRRGRKRGLGLMIATQRPALVSKNILSQCNNQIIGRLTIDNDIDAVKIFFSKKKELKSLPSLAPGEFYVLGDIGNKLVKIRKRKTEHKAVTPKLVRKSEIKSEDLISLEKSILSEKPVEGGFAEVRELIIPPLISKEIALSKIRKKKYVFFGPGVNIINFYLVLHPVFKCHIRFEKKSIFGKNFHDILAFFDGCSGNILTLKSGFSVRYKIKNLIGLSTEALTVFKLLSKKSGQTVKSLSLKLNLSESTVRSALKELYGKALITSSRRGRSVFYYLLTKTKLPNIESLSHPNLELVEKRIEARKVEPEVNIDDIRKFVKALNPQSEIVDHSLVYYPFYRIVFSFGKKSEEISVDAVSGKLI